VGLPFEGLSLILQSRTESLRCNRALDGAWVQSRGPVSIQSEVTFSSLVLPYLCYYFFHPTHFLPPFILETHLSSM